MTKWLRRGMVAAVLAGGLATAGATAASGAGSTSGNAGLLNGNQIQLPIQVPINVCGNAVGVLGTAAAKCEGGASATNTGSGGKSTSSHNLGLGNGNQVNAPISVPVNVCGNAVGNAAAKCDGGASATTSGSGGGNSTHGNIGILNGNQIDLPIQVPVNVCGNAVGVLGSAHAWCAGGASASNGGPGKGDGYASTNASSTSGSLGIAGGNQVTAPISVPVNACGNSVAVLGAAAASCQGGASAPPANCPPQNNSGGGLLGIANGNQICAPIQVPVNVCGNAVGVAGSAQASCEAPAPPVQKPPAPGGGGKGALPNTGFSVGLPLGLAAVLLIGGSAAVMLGRKRQSKHTSV